MSVALYWKPKVNNELRIPTSCANAFKENIEKVFGECPIELNEASYKELNIMLLMDEANSEAYAELINALHDHGNILVTKEY